MPQPFITTIALPEGFEKIENIIALGGELKNTLCLLSDGQANISRVMGDLEQEGVYRHFVEQFDTIFNQSKPSQLVVDKHPDYLSRQLGSERATRQQIKLRQVQHHHAHIAAVMADNGLALGAKPVLGFALDGLGFGDDGTLWGGEVLLADYHGFQRLACFQPVAMIGGVAAIREPWRNTLAHLLPIWPEVNDRFFNTEIIRFLNKKPLPILQTMVNKGLNSPLASSCGRLFDAVAAALGICCESVEFEAQAAIQLEKLAATCFEQATLPYSYDIDESNKHCLRLNWQAMWVGILKNIQENISHATIASRFHHTLIHALTELALQFRKLYYVDCVAFSGGVFQNKLISTHLSRRLEDHGFKVLQHRQVSSHDGGLSLGQAIISAAHRDMA